ncbi:NACHT, LRR and PYD domains-containing protein 1-like isoform X2 [Asterias amurensis]
MDDIALQDLARQLGQEWPALGVNLGLKWAQIEHSKADNPMHTKSQIMDMLVTWRRGLGPDADPKQLLVRGLDAVDRTDLAWKVATNELFDSKNRTDIRTDFDLKACQAELVDYYLNNLCKVRMHPLIPSLVRDLGSIYTDLQLVRRTHPCMYEQSGSRPTDCSSLEGETNTKETHLSHQSLVSLDCRGRYRVLLTGKTGSGKSTLLKKITHDWSSLTALDVDPSLNSEEGSRVSDSALKQGSPLSKFMLLFTLQLNQMSENPNLVDAIFDQILSRDTKVSKPDLKNYIENHQNKVLFLLDGFEELPPNVLGKTKATDNLKDVLLCRALRHSCIIVTSQHHVANQFFKIYPLFARVETTGLGLRGREEYINKYFKNSQTGAKLISAIRSSVTLSGLSEIPLLLQMICLVWADRNSLPERLTELYDNAVKILLMHHEGKKEDSLPSRSKLPDGLLNRLGRVALEGLLGKDGERLVFPVEDFQQGDAARGCEIGLLVPEDAHRGLDVQSTVAFLHCTFQELCAASYLADLFKTDKKRFIRYVSKLTEFSMINLEYLLRFCCGKSKKAARWILSRAKKLQKQCVVSYKADELQRLRLMFYLEARSKTLISLLSDIVSFPSLGGEHLIAAHYFVQCKRSLPKVTSLSVVCTSPAESRLVMNIVHHTPKLEHLLMWLNGAMDSGEDEGSFPILANLKSMSFRPLASSLPCQCSLVPNFISHQINLSTIFLSDIDMHGKVNVFQTHSSILQCLRLINCYLVFEDIKTLCRVLSDAKDLLVLDLSGNNLSGTLDFFIPIVPRLKELAMAKCGLRDVDNESLVRVLSVPHNLPYLKLSQNTMHGLLDTVTSNAPGVQVLQL